MAQTKHTRQLMKLVGEATSPFHCVEAIKKQLEDNGFQEIFLNSPWELKAGGHYYAVSNDSTLIGFCIGEEYKPGGSFRIAAAHTDFPGLRIKPNPDMGEEGYRKINTEIYGGAILSTWMDRPLSVAGRVALKSGQIMKPQMRLVDFKRPIMTIPNLAIHLNREANKGVELNRQTDMIPVAGIMQGEPLFFTKYLAGELRVQTEDILDYELYAYVCEKGDTIGMQEEFISSPRLDNLTSVQAITTGLINGNYPNGIQVAAFFDHEEVGSRTKQGAGSVLLSTVLEKIYKCMRNDRISYLETLSDSMFLSVDVSHGYHPNQGGKYDPSNRAVLGSGITIKESSAQSYATDARGTAIVIQMCQEHSIPYCKFVNHSNLIGGSTLGSVASAFLPVLTVDIGIPVLAMHSAREMMGAADQKTLTDFMTVYYSVKE